ncbi:DNA-directed RNA polymerase subunit omega [Thermophagus xiamenensis]|uniref:DNA-directed RNA polymerase subunit omega n=1 Tax=Thermophagus xiamenensis TaxID=385682 RepID=A0A1I2EY35_9BACT|nr:DNA-directed RNA polymerase subunit omega [Thermophagus xiamenensis]SFE97709.1 RNA polymerase Rpb6 [Thermophagus xiamenensis]
MDYKKSKAPSTTVTWDTNQLSAQTENIYESVMIISKRANQIGVEMKEELNKKLQEFASYTDNLEEVFENREQIEISKFYERLPKPALLATQEFVEGKIYYRNPAKDKQQVEEEE